jgi:prepilin-type N-terminal cleavage/methylation domain-containing protein
MGALPERQRMGVEPAMKINRFISRRRLESGFSMIEVMISMVIITIGLLAALASLAVTMGANQTSQEDMIARQLASEAMESIFNARDSSQLTWAQINNTSSGGIFLPGANSPMCAGPDGILDTADDVACVTASGAECPNGGIECLTEPGPDGILGTSDDVILSLNNYTRTVTISPLLDSSGNTIPTLVQVTITIAYSVSSYQHTKTYTLIDYISSYH